MSYGVGSGAYRSVRFVARFRQLFLGFQPSAGGPTLDRPNPQRVWLVKIAGDFRHQQESRYGVVIANAN
jgi:hypothetical protein